MALRVPGTDLVDDDLLEWNQDPGLLNRLADVGDRTAGRVMRSDRFLGPVLIRPDGPTLRIIHHCS